MLRMYLNVAYIFKCCENDSSGKQSDPGKSQFVIFRSQKYVKKGCIEMTKKISLETFKKVSWVTLFPTT